MHFLQGMRRAAEKEEGIFSEAEAVHARMFLLGQSLHVRSSFKHQLLLVPLLCLDPERREGFRRREASQREVTQVSLGLRKRLLIKEQEFPPPTSGGAAGRNWVLSSTGLVPCEPATALGVSRR